MEMKSTPRLKFMADKSFETASEMTNLLKQPHIRQDLDVKR